MDESSKPDILKVSILGKESIHCGLHLIPYIVHTVLTSLPSSTYVLFTDTHVAKFHFAGFQKAFDQQIRALSEDKRPRFLSHFIPPGETSKSREGKAELEDFLLGQACTRDTVLLALGGGVIGDLVGFVAATFMRGIRVVQIPTTLLAMVDSSVGGKTAIDTPHGKNLIGAFWQPEYIFIDATFLETLPPREFSNGMAEVVKTAAIWDENEFASLESRALEITSAVQSGSTTDAFAGRTLATRSEAQQLLLSVIVGSISVKAHIVTIDERETGLRNLVNFGHTIGHAIEAILTPKILHGECVSIGMIFEAEIARQLGVLSQVAIGRLTRCLKAYNLPVSLSDPRIASLPAAGSLTVDRLLDIMKVDKKNSGPAKKVVILSRIGATFEPKATVVPDDQIRKTLSESVTVVPGVPANSPVTMATPGSKSISNRALVLAALGKGTCRLRNLLHSDDTAVMMQALVDLKGATFSWEDGGDTLVVEGGAGSLSVPQHGKEIYLQNAGTAARFLTTVCALVKSSEPGAATVITGNARMKQRPCGPLVDALRSSGSKIEYGESEGCLPLSISATPTGFKGGHIRLAASVSSQYVSSILLCAPYSAEPVILELTGGQVISQPYIDMTIGIMRSFGIQVTREKDASGNLMDIYRIPSGHYTNPAVFSIESDASSATYPLAIAAITGTTCTIANIGSSSLQGDAGFAKGVLEPMGCKVIQTETETTVTGPPIGQLRAIGYVDMEPMTDAFLTASVLAAVATQQPFPDRVLEGVPQTTTRILGIANQRVKECNRIKAMIDELAKFGVRTKELDDGLEIYGVPISELKEGAQVHCYDDHRVAMAFSVLAAVVKSTVIDEKRCVAKTWPNWWDDLENKIGLKVEGVQVKSVDTSTPSHEEDASVVLVGMRGAGKTYIGGLAAEALGWGFIDADAIFEQKHAMLVSEFVREQGWPAFRDAEKVILDELLASKSRHHIISLGGGVVEIPAARQTLKTYAQGPGHVVHIIREIDEIVQYLGAETSRPAYGEAVQDVFTRRQPWFKEVADHEFINYSGVLQPAREVATNGHANGDTNVKPDSTLPMARHSFKQEVARFFRHISGVQPNLASNLQPGKRSYFLSLTFPDLTPALSSFDQLTVGVDAIEVRADLLSPTGFSVTAPAVPTAAYVARQLAALRQVTSLPIVFTLRTASQGGMFPDWAIDEAFTLCELALRLGCEYIDTEVSWPEGRIQNLAAGKGSSKIIASWHDWSGKMKWSGEEVKGKHALAAKLGDIVKIVGKANSLEDNFALYHFVQSVTRGPSAKPVIAINMGREGQLSRILNPTFSPVSHPLLPTRAAPGQLSFAEIQKALHLIGQLPPQKFHLFGTPIAHSMSPTLHNTGFGLLGLPYKYSLLETASVDDTIKRVMRADDFGGASVTIPHKLAIMPLLDSISVEAKTIGAVNTVIPRVRPDGTRELYGDNTDWAAIRDCAMQNLSEPVTSDTTALVIGAGGTSRAALYALHSIGLKTIYLFNRTQASAQALATSFPSEYNIVLLGDIASFSDHPPSIIVSTVPASGTSTDKKNSQDAIYLPASLLSSPKGGVIIDMAYKPSLTPLLSLAQGAHPPWATVTGLSVLLEQGYRQFEMWTGRKAPRSIMEAEVWARYNL